MVAQGTVVKILRKIVIDIVIHIFGILFTCHLCQRRFCSTLWLGVREVYATSSSWQCIFPMWCFCSAFFQLVVLSQLVRNAALHDLYIYIYALEALLFSTNLQTFTPQKGHCLSLCMSFNAVRDPQKVWVRTNKTGTGTSIASKHARKYEATHTQLKTILVCAGVGGYKRKCWCNLSCLLLTCCHLSTNEKLPADSSETYAVRSGGSGWRKDISEPVLYRD